MDLTWGCCKLSPTSKGFLSKRSRQEQQQQGRRHWEAPPSRDEPKVKRGIVEQCCHKPCSVYHLEGYCDWLLPSPLIACIKNKKKVNFCLNTCYVLSTGGNKASWPITPWLLSAKMLKFLLFYNRVHTVEAAACNSDFCSNATLQVLECTLLAEDEHWPTGSGWREKRARREVSKSLSVCLKQDFICLFTKMQDAHSLRVLLL